MARIYKTIIIGFFLVMLILPNILMLFDINNKIELNENKAGAKLPTWTSNIPVLAKETRRYYLDNFGFKKVSFLFYAYVKSTILNENPLPNRVVEGKEGWFFLGDFAQNVFSNNSGAKTIMPQEKVFLEKNINSYFENSKSAGIPFYMVVCPDKHQIYNEFLPFKLSDRISKFDAVLKSLSDKDKRLVLLQEELLKRKREDKIYFKTDSHWNDLGAFYGFNALIEKMQIDFPALRTLSVAEFNFNTKMVGRKDLTNMINHDAKEEVLELTPKNSNDTQQNSFYNGVRVRKFFNPEKKLKVVVFHDSYSFALMKYFVATFKESVFVKSYPNYELIENEKPDIVILEMVNRKLEDICAKQVF